ncbi:MAG: hypothetical protein A49_09720 [Methyloceanibacter sp.]|nr:MAG: hypothetical protein A49_09720 [Methyloceanibacter sp.]
MSTTGQTLRQARRALGDPPLRQLAKQSGQFSKSTLNELELDRRSVRDDEIKPLATLYNIPEGVLKKEADRDAWRQSVGPEAAEPFLNRTLSHAREGDHIVVVAQRSIVPDNTEIPRKLVELAAEGVAITYVAGLVSGASGDDRWQTNHPRAARLIYQEARTSGRQKYLINIHYLLIKEPAPGDFAFLRAYDAAIYFRRNTDSLEDSCVWVEVEIEPGKCWWTPAAHMFQGDLDYWLVHECGLQLPAAKVEVRGKGAGRNIEFRNLVEFLGHDAVQSYARTAHGKEGNE